MNLIKLFTLDGPVYVDAGQLGRAHRTHLTIFTSQGNKLKEVGTTKAIREAASYGVHRDNLFATQELAEADYQRILREIFGTAAITAAA